MIPKELSRLDKLANTLMNTGVHCQSISPFSHNPLQLSHLWDLTGPTTIRILIFHKTTSSLPLVLPNNSPNTTFTLDDTY